MVSSIGSAYNSALDFIDVTCNWEDVSHIQYKCERCESTNQFATRRQRYLAPLPGVLFFILKTGLS